MKCAWYLRCKILRIVKEKRELPEAARFAELLCWKFDDKKQ